MYKFGMYLKLLVVWLRDMGHDSRSGVIDGKVRDEDDQVDVRCFLKERQLSIELRRCLGVEAIGYLMRK